MASSLSLTTSTSKKLFTLKASLSLTTSTSKKLFTLKASDGETFQVEESVANQSGTIKHMMNEGYHEDTIEFPLPNVMSKILKQVIEYCEKHVESAAAMNKEEELKEWDSKFINGFDTNVLYHLFLAANYLEVKGLMDLIVDRIVNLIKGKSPEAIRKIFGIKNDFTPEKEEEIRNENPWAFEIPEIDNDDKNKSETPLMKVEEKLEKLEIQE